MGGIWYGRVVLPSLPEAFSVQAFVPPSTVSCSTSLVLLAISNMDVMVHFKSAGISAVISFSIKKEGRVGPPVGPPLISAPFLLLDNAIVSNGPLTAPRTAKNLWKGHELPLKVEADITDKDEGDLGTNQWENK